MDLSKAYDSLPHDHRWDWLTLIHNYLSSRKQQTKIISSYSGWYNICDWF